MTTAENISHIRHLPMHARSCPYYMGEDCTCGIGNHNPLECIPARTFAATDRVIPSTRSTITYLNIPLVRPRVQHNEDYACLENTISADIETNQRTTNYTDTMGLARTQKGPRMVVPYPGAPIREEGSGMYIDPRYIRDEAELERLERSGPPFRGAFYRHGDVSGPDGVTNGFWPRGRKADSK